MLNVILRACYVLLLLLGIAAQFWFTPPNAPVAASVIMALVLYLPLLLLMVAPITLHPRSLTWLCFLLLFYFCGYVVQCLNPPPQRTFAIVQVSLTVVMFVAAMQLIRRGGRAD
ncbi:DUF2069 domain-containing protein [Alloalcanivorax gelatiniphagus]|uniref:DUF2069 domain-containing protein n=1 Tax=Alloalcanivorax gelatiniphagus TaxID=1194167 RepID=A0ABY2XLR4_9GAMM|nr:DUF2069 domain-containing protein [Alloalcanivorax gelatiniphagus]TMW13165.1 DUF2069 domain-containing protein [Alloalcanivorax gelatiniphagus]